MTVFKWFKIYVYVCAWKYVAAHECVYRRWKRKWTAYNCRYFVHLVSRWSPLILTVLTNQFIKIVNVIQSCLVQYRKVLLFSLTLYFAIALLDVNMTYTWRVKQPVFCEKDVTCHVHFQLVSLFWNPKGIFHLTLIRHREAWSCNPFPPSAFPPFNLRFPKWKILGIPSMIQWFGLSTPCQGPRFDPSWGS